MIHQTSAALLSTGHYQIRFWGTVGASNLLYKQTFMSWKTEVNWGILYCRFRVILSHQFETFRKGQGVVAEATSLAFPPNFAQSSRRTGGVLTVDEI